MGKGGVGRVARGPTRSADPNKLSCEEYAGPKGEGKHRMDPRQRMFTSAFNRFGLTKSEEWTVNIGPAAYQAPDSSVMRSEFTGSTWMPRDERWRESNSIDESALRDTSFTFDRDFRQNWVAESGGARVGTHVHNMAIDKADRFQVQPGENASWCSADFYDTSRSLDYLRYPGRLTPDGTNVTKSMFESNSIRFPDDPAAHLGPGSHDYKTPDEVEAEKKAVRRDPSFTGGISHQGSGGPLPSALCPLPSACIRPHRERCVHRRRGDFERAAARAFGARALPRACICPVSLRSDTCGHDRCGTATQATGGRGITGFQNTGHGAAVTIPQGPQRFS